MIVRGTQLLYFAKQAFGVGLSVQDFLGKTRTSVMCTTFGQGCIRFCYHILLQTTGDVGYNVGYFVAPDG